MHVYVDSRFQAYHGHGDKLIHNLFYARMGLQNIFNLQGLNLHINFEVIGNDKLGYETYPSVDNLK